MQCSRAIITVYLYNYGSTAANYHYCTELCNWVRRGVRRSFTKQIGSLKYVNPMKENTHNTHLFEDGLYPVDSPFALCPFPLVWDKHKGIFLLQSSHFFWRMTKLLQRTDWLSVCIANALRGGKICFWDLNIINISHSLPLKVFHELQTLHSPKTLKASKELSSSPEDTCLK